MSIPRPTILLVSAIAPAYGSGSGIILLRHVLKFAEAGWQVTVCVPEHTVAGMAPLPATVRVIALPRRRWWWPPVRESVAVSEAMRVRLFAGYLLRMLDGAPPTHVLTLLWDEAPRVAAKIASHLAVPLGCLIHDQQEMWASDAKHHHRALDRAQSVIAASRTVFAVSDAILTRYAVPAEKRCVLYPIPGHTRYFEADASRSGGAGLRVYYGGSLHAWQEPNFLALADALARRGGRLVLLTAADNHVWLRVSAAFPETERRDPPADNEAAVRMIASEADVCLVSYSMSFEQQSWAASSFPSKLLDFSRAGVPILVIAPPGSATHDWCRAHAWKTFVPDIRTETLQAMIDDLGHTDFRQAAAEQVQRFACSEFSADTIHRVLETALVTPPAPRGRLPGVLPPLLVSA
jgi:hypothetical protein